MGQKLEGSQPPSISTIVEYRGGSMVKNERN